MSTPFGLSLSITGSWSPHQARALVEALAPELKERGLALVPIDVTTCGGLSKVVLMPRCRMCGRPIDEWPFRWSAKLAQGLFR